MEAQKWRLIIAIVVIWTLLGLMFAGISYLAAASENMPGNGLLIFSTTLLRFYIWAAFAPLIYKFSRRFALDERGASISRGIFVHVPLGLLLAVLHSGIYTCIVWFLNPSYNQRYKSIVKFFQEYVFFGNLYLGILLYALIVISVQAVLFYQRYEHEELKNSELKAKLAGAQLQALKMQLQPHFLFNTLHSIAALNLINPPQANVMIARLGEFLRMTLDSSDEQMVTLKDELDFLKCYLEIEQIRFSDRLTIEFDVDSETLTTIVPHLILQPLAENAIKHGIAPHSTPGHIVIKAKKNKQMILIEIRDNGAGIRLSDDTRNDPAQKTRNGRGLQNVRSRLEEIYNSNFRFETKHLVQGGLAVILEVPDLPEKLERGQAVLVKALL